MLPGFIAQPEDEPYLSGSFLETEYTDPDVDLIAPEGLFLDGIYFFNSGNYLRTPTYDGSGQAVHPDIVYFPEGWQGYKYWMAFTPYPFGKRAYENPSILVSQDGYSWEVPPGLKNPIVGSISRGYHADPDLLYNQDTEELWLYFMRFRDNQSYLYRVRSGDGINWSGPELILQEPSFGMLSPSVIYQGGLYRLWYVDSGRAGINSGYTEVKYRTSDDGVNWSQPQKVSVDLQGHQVWHLEVSYIPSAGEFWMFFPGFKEGHVANHTDLFFARATGPLEWMVSPQPVLTRSAGKTWDNTRIYQASFLYDEDSKEIRLWYSAAQRVWTLAYLMPYPTYIWRIGYTDFTFILMADQGIYDSP
ncbi:MAG: hypothetical protein PHQ54_04460 [Candidatus Omnitrophica bacterium]|nr:hypothetical protein [Candidatus Omnitrophota bacterium]